MNYKQPHHNHQNKTPPHEQKPIWQDKQDRRQHKPRPDIQARQNVYKCEIQAIQKFNTIKRPDRISPGSSKTLARNLI